MTMMQFRNGSSMTNLYTYFVILFIFILLVASIQKLGADLLTNPNANLDDKSINYIATINGIDLSDYEKTGDTLYESEVSTDNSTGSAIKDFSLEYFFAREKSKSFESKLGKKTLFNIPERIIVTLFGAPKTDYGWLFMYINWFVWIALGIGVILFIRGIWTK